MNKIQVSGLPNFAGVEFSFDTDLPLQANKAFPEELFEANGGEIPIAGIKASANKKFTLGNGSKNVEFNAKAEGIAALGVYRKAEKLLDALQTEGLSEPMANLMNLKIADDENLLALRWGYNLEAGAKGQVALIPAASPLKLTFGASGQKTGLSVLLHAQGRTETIFDSIKNTLESWKVPRQVQRVSELNPKTTVIYETFGKLDLSLGVEYGYNYNWVRESINIGGLSGDFGMKIEMAVKAQLGFSASGRYALALSRETDAETIRVQVFRMKQKGWSFAFDGGISSQITKVPFPDNIDDFIKGVFNLNGSQVMKDLEKWLDPNAKLEDLLSEEIFDFAKDIIKKVTGIDPIADAKNAIEKLQKLITRWHELPHEVTALLYGLLGKGVNLKGLKDFLGEVVKFAENPDKVAEEIQKYLPDFEFFSTPIGKWLSAVSNEGVISLLANLETELKKEGGVLERAKQTLALLDGSEVENMLEELQKWIDEKFQIKKIENLDPEKWDAWLKKRLADFFAKDKLIPDELKKIRNAVIELRKKASEFYGKGYEALMKKYSFDVHFAFQKTTTRDALIDLTLDFSGAKAAEAEKCLEQALDGDFSKLLVNKKADDKTPLTCVTINQAVFTHEIKRNLHLEVNLPNFSGTLDHITNSVAKNKVIDTADGRLWVFTLEAEDILKKRRSLSRLSAAVELSETEGVRTFSKDNDRLDYSFLYGKYEVNRKYIEMRYELGANSFLRSAFPKDQGSFSQYLDELDRHLDADFPGSNKFGNVLTSLKVSLPGKVMSVWEKVPPDLDNNFYQKTSLLVQRIFRDWIPLNFIEDKEQYGSPRVIYPLLAYCALPRFTNKLKEDGDFYFYWKYESEKSNVFNGPLWQDNLRQKVLKKADDETDDPRYEVTNDNLKAIAQNVLNTAEGKSRFESLCGFEKNIIQAINTTAKNFHQFKTETEIEKKIEALAEFGISFTNTFNNEMGHIDYIPKGAFRPLGLLLFLNMAQLLEPELSDTKLAAMLEILVLKPEISGDDFKKAKAKFFEGEYPETKDLVLQQRIVNVDIPAQQQFLS